MEEDQDHPVGVEEDHLAEVKEDHLAEEVDHQEEDNLQLLNNQCWLHQMSKPWEVSHKSLTEIDLKQMISSRKSRVISALMPTFQDTTPHIRKWPSPLP